MEAVFKIVLTTSFYAGIVGMVILLVKNLLQDKLNPRWHYWLWIVLLVKLIIPFGPESAFSLYNVLEPLSQEIKFSSVPETVGDAGIYSPEGTQAGNERPGLPAQEPVASAQNLRTYVADALPIIWLSGLLLMFVWLLYAGFSFAGKLKTHAQPASPAVQALLEECKTRAEVKGEIAVLIQDIVKVPSLVGMFKPRILLTPDILRLKEQDISYILLHELSHYRRKDLWVNYLLLILQIIHWFNPVIWYCFRRIRQDMEVAADEGVLSLLKVSEHKEYGKALLAVLETINTKTRLMPRLIGMVDERKNIERRIRMIKMADFFKSRRKRVILTGILCVVILGGLLWTSASARVTSDEGGEDTDAISQNSAAQPVTGQSIEEAVSLAVKEKGKGYLEGEALTEGHKILEVEEKDGTVIAYTVASIGWFGFENGIFTGVSGSGAIPTVMTFAKNANGEYSLLEYKEAEDGGGYGDSIKRNFPQRLWDSIFSGEHYPELVAQKEAQARQYLQSIGRDAQVSQGYVEKKLVDINVEASNRLFAELTKGDAELNRFPYWIGTKEYLDQGERFIYETSQGKTSDGYDLVTFRKSKEDGRIEREYQYKIVGNELTLVFLQSTPELKP
ncbi:hypothetical protein SDC9_18669 [bioreactor metagenome]|uniref:Peptidase, M56 n=2 Tax=root TaxID=1 RepID=A0A098B1G0_DESHA|nr:M56 family metallopeptidase [Desulfitobacterium hafniense]MEA5024628.1 M56 family metallopeptidase [Desulfitobacterium hafniense]CDX02723.1 Peptidase, M56 [Desulfitobacterium hafniense]